jgi:peptidyl-dipeptidase Dcp
VEYTASALLDMAIHAETDPSGVDITEFERQEVQRIGCRARSCHVTGCRTSAICSRAPVRGRLLRLLWAEVLDADGYDAFVEAGSPFDRAVAERVKRFIYSSGGTLPPAEAYRSFRGRDPRVEPLLASAGWRKSPRPA